MISMENMLEFDERIASIHEIYEEEVNYELFWLIVSHLNDGPLRRGSFKIFDLHGWLDNFNNGGTKIREPQLDLIFNYVVKYYANILCKTAGDKYKVVGYNNVTDENQFLFERIALKR